MSQPTDRETRELALAAGHGDRQAFRLLYEQFLERVRAQVRRMLGPAEHILDDVVQEAFVQAFRSLPNYRGDAAFSTWMFRVTHNVTVTAIRRRVVRPTDLVSLSNLGQSIEQPDFDARRQVVSLYAALDEMSPEAREAFVLYELEGRSLKEIAELLSTSLNTVAARVRRARERLRRLLGRGSAARRKAQ